MNLLFRLVWLALFGRGRASVSVLGPCRTPFRVLPTDLDILRHVNNGVYFSLMDVARVDLMRRAGLLGKLGARGWYPVVLAETMQFRRSLTVFERFEIVTRVLAWDDKAFILEQRFERKGETVARALLRSCFLRREGGRVAPSEILALAELPADLAPPLLSPIDARWALDNATWIGDAAIAAEEQPA